MGISRVDTLEKTAVGFLLPESFASNSLSSKIFQLLSDTPPWILRYAIRIFAFSVRSQIPCNLQVVEKSLICSFWRRFCEV